jgi:hypothetical protein
LPLSTSKDLKRIPASLEIARQWHEGDGNYFVRARLLSQQEDFVNQPSMLETVITEAGHEYMFPKFHCPIEMASYFLQWSF